MRISWFIGLPSFLGRNTCLFYIISRIGHVVVHLHRYSQALAYVKTVLSLGRRKQAFPGSACLPSFNTNDFHHFKINARHNFLFWVVSHIYSGTF
ncbi:hypothetical protein SAMN02745866_00685 [Alteromonadaceae bacterium Bs31]|nr:hypothetical protein SAMN02745866_00685 [Alteromonadaceae bacterium Bs31]